MAPARVAIHSHPWRLGRGERAVSVRSDDGREVRPSRLRSLVGGPVIGSPFPFVLG